MIDTATNTETLSIPLGNLGEASVHLRFGGGELVLRPADAGVFLAGTFEGGVVLTSTIPGRIDLEPRGPGHSPLSGCRLHWDVALTKEIPVDLRLDTGGNKSTIDLSDLRIRRLELRTGASETSVSLPGTGETTVDVECGFAAVNLEVPQGAAARVRGHMTLGATEVDEARFPRTRSGWESPDYATAEVRVDVDIEGAFGTVRVR